MACLPPQDDKCSFRRHAVMLLSNLCQTTAGCLQLMQKDDRSSADLVGTHLRRLIALFLTPPGSLKPHALAAASATLGTSDGSEPGAGTAFTEGDDFEYAAPVLQNVTQDADARTIILHPERGILAPLLQQLSSRSVIRRRGVAGAIRNCCLNEERARAGAHGLLKPSLNFVERIVRPLVGPEPFRPGERDIMPASWLSHGPAKRRDADPATRRALVETLVLLTSSKDGRAELRRLNVYPVLRNLHYWLEGETSLLASLGKGGGLPFQAATSITTAPGPELRVAAEASAAAKEASASAGFKPEEKPSGDGGEGDAEEDDLPPDDAKTIDAIHQLVQLLQAEEGAEDAVDGSAIRASGDDAPAAAAAATEANPEATSDTAAAIAVGAAATATTGSEAGISATSATFGDVDAAARVASAGFGDMD